MNYENVSVRYQRKGDKVTPIRSVKQWIGAPGNGKASKSKGEKKFMTVRSSVVGFKRPSHGPEEWTSIKAPPPDRQALIAKGLIRPEGHGLACLGLDDPSTWMASVVNNPLPPWSDPYEIGTEQEE